MYAIYEFIYLCVWHLQQISVYGIYVFIYIYVHLMLWNQQICKTKKIWAPIRRRHCRRRRGDHNARISHTPRAKPSAQATLYAEGYAVGVCPRTECLAASHVSLDADGIALGVCPRTECLAAGHVSLDADDIALGVCPSCRLA
jgi:hypothetical protein